MIIVCPACQNRYQVEASALTAQGCRVRCASCQHAWMCGPQGEIIEPAETGTAASDSGAPPASKDQTLFSSRADIERQRRHALDQIERAAAPHKQYRQQQNEKHQRRLQSLARVPWAVAGGIFIVLVGIFFAARESIVRDWPEAGSVYALFGQKLNRFGLELHDVELVRAYEGAEAVLSVSGKALNVSMQVQAAVPVQIGLQDESGKTLGVWFAALEADKIAPGEQAKFGLHIPAPPKDAVKLEAYFVSISEKKAYKGDKAHKGDKSHKNHKSDGGHEDHKTHGDNKTHGDKHGDHGASPDTAGHDDGHD